MTHPAKIAKPVVGMSEQELGDWLEALPPAPGLPETDEEIAASDARALEDLKAGRVYQHAVVSEWLRTWGRSDRRTFKEWLADRHA